MTQNIPTDARFALIEARAGADEETYLDFIWAKREREHPGATQSTGTWPFERLEWRGVTKLQTKLRAKG
jgi:hypothetical protein